MTKSQFFNIVLITSYIGLRKFSSTPFLNVKRDNLTSEEEKKIQEMSQESYDNSPSYPGPASAAACLMT